MPQLLEAQAKPKLRNHAGYMSIFMKWTQY